MASFINLLAIFSLAVLACSFGASPVTALATDYHQVRDIIPYGHGAIARRKRAVSNNFKRCKHRPSSTPHNPNKGHKPASTTHKPTSTSTPPSGGSSGPAGGGKVGLAWPNGPSQNIKPFVNKHVGYYYTWSPNNIPQADELGVMFLAQFWGDRQTSEFSRLVKKGYAHGILGFNEPEMPGQSNMSPAHGAFLWKTYIEPKHHEGFDMICSPATSSSPKGMVWVKEFLKECNGQCTWTCTATHFYDTTAEKLISYLKLWHDTFGKDVILTEFACQNFNGGPQCSKSEIEAFVTESVKFMEGTSWMMGYFAFGFMKNMQGVNTLNQLMTSSGLPTVLGSQILNP